MMKVICISQRENYPEQIKIDEQYTIDRDSIFIDVDGDVYGRVYDYDGINEIGLLKLNHFRSIY